MCPPLTEISYRSEDACPDLAHLLTISASRLETLELVVEGRDLIRDEAFCASLLAHYPSLTAVSLRLYDRFMDDDPTLHAILPPFFRAHCTQLRSLSLWFNCLDLHWLSTLSLPLLTDMRLIVTIAAATDLIRLPRPPTSVR